MIKGTKYLFSTSWVSVLVPFDSERDLHWRYLSILAHFLFFFFNCCSSTVVSIFTPPRGPSPHPSPPPTLEPSPFNSRDLEKQENQRAETLAMFS